MPPLELFFGVAAMPLAWSSDAVAATNAVNNDYADPHFLPKVNRTNAMSNVETEVVLCRFSGPIVVNTRHENHAYKQKEKLDLYY